MSALARRRTLRGCRNWSVLYNSYNTTLYSTYNTVNPSEEKGPKTLCLTMTSATLLGREGQRFVSVFEPSRKRQGWTLVTPVGLNEAAWRHRKTQTFSIELRPRSSSRREHPTTKV